MFDNCEACGQPIRDGQEMTIVTDASVFNDGEVEHHNTWRYHAEHVSVTTR